MDLVGIFCLTSDSTCGLVIHMGKAVIFAFTQQVQLLQGIRGSAWRFRFICSEGSSDLECVVTPDLDSVLAVD
eukprot:2048468-Ditylum_brightwellii.AAC.1